MRTPAARIAGGLGGSRDQRVRKLSGGQKRRLDLAMALVGDPELIFLDEPTTGFDPGARRESWDMIEALRDLGRTVLLTTHYMDEAQHLADRVGVIVRGRLVALDRPDALVSASSSRSIIRFAPDRAAADALPAFDGEVRHVGAAVEIATVDPAGDLQALTAWALRAGVDLSTLVVERPTLEDVYVELTGELEAAAAEESRR